MGLTPHQIEMRKTCLGASETAVILGLKSFKNVMPVTIQADKIFEKEAEDNTDDAILYGHLFEESLIQFCLKRLGLQSDPKKDGKNCSVRRNQFMKSKEDKRFGATLDALIKYPVKGKKDEIIEAKTANLANVHADHSQWGDDGTDYIPDNYIIQCQQQMFVRALDRVYVPALIGNKGMFLYEIERNEDLIKSIRDVAGEWWDRHVIKKEPITQSEQDEYEAAGNEIISYAKIKRVPGKEVDVDYADAYEWEKAKFFKSMATKWEAVCKKRLLVKMGDASHAILPDGRKIVNKEVVRNNKARKASVTKFYQLKFDGKPDADLLEENGYTVDGFDLKAIGA